MSGKVETVGQRARAAAKKAGRLHISAALPCLARAAREAAERGLFHVDVKLEGVWFMDKTNQRDLRRFLQSQQLYAVNPRQEGNAVVLTLCWGDFPPEESMHRAAPVALGKAVVLVINGTSNCGKAALVALKEYAHLYTIRATTRGAVTEKLLSDFPHVQWVQCDFSAASLLHASRGADKVFYVMPPAQNRVELAQRVADALRASNVSYLVHVSVMGADYRSILFTRQAKDSEEIFEKSGVPVTHLRCSGFHENMLANAATIKSHGVFYQPWGAGAMSTVSVVDIGRAAARLLTRMGAEGVKVDLTGPEALDNNACAAILSEELGRTITAVSPPVPDFVQTLKTYGMEAWMADGMGELVGLIASGMTAGVTSDGTKLLGRMTTFREFVRANRAAFQ